MGGPQPTLFREPATRLHYNTSYNNKANVTGERGRVKRNSWKSPVIVPTPQESKFQPLSLNHLQKSDPLSKGWCAKVGLSPSHLRCLDAFALAIDAEVLDFPQTGTVKLCKVGSMVAKSLSLTTRPRHRTIYNITAKFKYNAQESITYAEG